MGLSCDTDVCVCVCVVETLHVGEDSFSQNSMANPEI